MLFHQVGLSDEVVAYGRPFALVLFQLVFYLFDQLDCFLHLRADKVDSLGELRFVFPIAGDGLRNNLLVQQDLFDQFSYLFSIFLLQLFPQVEDHGPDLPLIDGRQTLTVIVLSMASSPPCLLSIILSISSMRSRIGLARRVTVSDGLLLMLHVAGRRLAARGLLLIGFGLCSSLCSHLLAGEGPFGCHAAACSHVLFVYYSL